MDLLWSLSHTISSSLSCFWQVLDKISPLLVLIISGCAVYIAFKAKREAKVAAQVTLFYQLMARYSSPEMGKALDIMRELFDVRNQDEAAFLTVVKKYHNEDLQLSTFRHPTKNIVVKAGAPAELFRHNYEETNQARLQIASFFTFSFDLFTDFNVLNDFYFKKICSIDTFKFLYHVIEWLELAFNPDYNRKTFTELLEQSGRKDIAYLKSQRPPTTWTEMERLVIML